MSESCEVDLAKELGRLVLEREQLLSELEAHKAYVLDVRHAIGASEGQSAVQAIEYACKDWTRLAAENLTLKQRIAELEIVLQDEREARSQERAALAGKQG